MLVITRKPGEWIEIGNYIFIELGKMTFEGKYKGKINIKIIEVDEYGNEDCYSRYMDEDPIDLGNKIYIAYLHSKGEQYKIGIDAPLEYEINRLDSYYDEDKSNDYVNEEYEDFDELKEKYKDELSWFFN